MKIRRAKIEDAAAIHDAHMRSICEVCSTDHSPEEIQGWGNRPFLEERVVKSITNHFVWVVADGEAIEGYAHLNLFQRDEGKFAYVHGLYLTPKAIGKGFGQELVHSMLAEARKAGRTVISLESTLTAHAFYKKIGFKDTGPEMRVEVGGVGVRCFPMEYEFKD